MKRASTIIKEIEKLECELKENYSEEQIKSTIEKLEKQGIQFF